MRTYNRQLSMAAMCGVKPGHTMAEVAWQRSAEVEQMKLPEGYTFFWDSQYKDQREAMQAIAKFFPAGIPDVGCDPGRFVRQFPATDYYSLCVAFVADRSGGRNVVDRFRFRLFPYCRLVRAVGDDYKECDCPAG